MLNAIEKYIFILQDRTLILIECKNSRVRTFGGAADDLLKNVGFLFGIAAWWFAHSSALLKLAGTSTPLTVKDARAISASVFAYWFGALLALGLIVMLIAAVIAVTR